MTPGRRQHEEASSLMEAQPIIGRKETSRGKETTGVRRIEKPDYLAQDTPPLQPPKHRGVVMEEVEVLANQDENKKSVTCTPRVQGTRGTVARGGGVCPHGAGQAGVQVPVTEGATDITDLVLQGREKVVMLSIQAHTLRDLDTVAPWCCPLVTWSMQYP